MGRNDLMGMEGDAGVRWALLDTGLWWPVTLLDAPPKELRHGQEITGGPTMYLFGTQSFTQGNMKTRVWRCVEHNQMAYGQPGLGISGKAVVDQFAAAIAEAEDYCTAWTRTSSAPEHSSKIPALIVDDRDGACVSDVESHFRMISTHEATLEQHWTSFVNHPAHQNLAMLKSSLDSTISTLLAIASYLSANALARSPPTTMAALYYALVTTIYFNEMNGALITAVSNEADRTFVSSYVRVMLWSLHCVIRPQLESQVMKQWTCLSTSVPVGIFNAAASLWGAVNCALKVTTNGPSIDQLNIAINHLGQSPHLKSMKQFRELLKTYARSLSTIEREWISPSGMFRYPSEICVPPLGELSCTARANHLALATSTVSALTEAPMPHPNQDHATTSTVSFKQRGQHDIESSNLQGASTRSEASDMRQAKEYVVTFASGPLGLKLVMDSLRVTVAEVLPGTQADRHGLIQKGDVLVKIQDVVVRDNTSIVHCLTKPRVRPLHVTFHRRAVEMLK
ncbi:hypothetical protein H310_06088 [Aphanomyces invadans]|uniref:PDZ domain-containing protein n=1 Tax=Aphanomyces invadans TaxID=157072 RepID=A0A024UAG8_9STRA|nr:hypothetical protein H310_06088 [Aphanomyces invadans]ETW02623.1 hypothetical protein H310_06088 [Aphanomyces invadans]|eukprot:XP_008869228.1 hypothetical protein H310_06088 [Aphanomyces invadans]